MIDHNDHHSGAAQQDKLLRARDTCVVLGALGACFMHFVPLRLLQGNRRGLLANIFGASFEATAQEGALCNE